MFNRAIILCLSLAVIFSGCSKRPAQPEQSRAATDRLWKAEYARMSAAVKTGMTEQEVLTALGEPTKRRTIIEGDIVQVWVYDIGPEIHFKVQFDRQGKVIGAHLDSPTMIQ